MEETAEEAYKKVSTFIDAPHIGANPDSPTEEDITTSSTVTDAIFSSTSAHSLDTSGSDTSTFVSKEEQLEIFKMLRNNDKSAHGPVIYYLLPNDWRKRWFMYCIDKTGEVPPPGPILTKPLLNSDWINDNVPRVDKSGDVDQIYYKESRMLPLREGEEGDSAEVTPVREALWKHFVHWYGLDGPEIVRDDPNEIGMHLMMISCQDSYGKESRTVRACVPKSITRLDFYRLLLEIFELPDVDSISSLDHHYQEDTNALAVTVHIKPCRKFFPLDWSFAETLPLAGALGLPNIGNTCYMASALQALSQSKELVMPLLQDASLQLGSISFEFCCLLKTLWSGLKSDLSDLKGSLAMKEHRFSSFAQQDSQELLAVVLDHINEELRVKRRAMSIETLQVGKENLSQQDAWGNYLLRNNSIVTRVFGGLLKSTVRCEKCSTLSTTFDPFLFLSLPIPSSSSPKITLNIVGIGRKQFKINNANFGQLEKELGFECIFVLLDSNHKFLHFINHDDHVSGYSDEQQGDFFDFGKKKNRGLVFVYPKNTLTSGTFSLVSFCTKSAAYFLTGVDYIGFPLFVPYIQLHDITEYLRDKLSINPSEIEFKLMQQTGNSAVYTARIQSELINSIRWIFDQLLPESPSSSPSTTTQDIISLDDCLAAFEAEETLTQEVGWKCLHCKKIRVATKRLNIAQLPESSLMIHLKRFSFSAGAVSNIGWFSSGSGRKVTTSISFPQFWKITDSSDNEVVFELYAVIEHYGSLFGGHYTCAARNFLTGQWYRYDDSVVREVEIDSVLENSQSSAYVLFYERKVIKNVR